VKAVVYEHEAAAQADVARLLWPRGDDVIIAIEWALARDPKAGLPYGVSDALRFAVFAGAKSKGMPSVDVLFRVEPDRVLIVDIEFY
jgi:hypothetical protein